jgi:hypothetical protein
MTDFTPAGGGGISAIDRAHAPDELPDDPLDELDDPLDDPLDELDDPLDEPLDELDELPDDPLPPSPIEEIEPAERTTQWPENSSKIQGRIADRIVWPDGDDDESPDEDGS